MRGTKQGFRRTIASLLVFLSVSLQFQRCRQGRTIRSMSCRIRSRKNRKTERYEGPEKTDGKQYQFPNNVKTSLQGELNGLTDDLTQISSRLEEIEQNIIDKNQEISDTQEKLEQAKETESSQYAAMKQRLRYLYRDNNRTYYEILFSAMTFSELLNQSIYVEKLHEYDHRMLLSYKAQREAIEEMEAKLEEEKAQLDDLQAQAKEQQASIMTSVNNTKNSISAYSGQIAEAQARADALGNQIAEQDKNIAALKKQLQEEIAKSRLAAKSAWRTFRGELCRG